MGPPHPPRDPAPPEDAPPEDAPPEDAPPEDARADAPPETLIEVDVLDDLDARDALEDGDDDLDEFEDLENSDDDDFEDLEDERRWPLGALLGVAAGVWAGRLFYRLPDGLENLAALALALTTAVLAATLYRRWVRRQFAAARARRQP